ncbi:MAG TPA: Ig-like domain repeat protein, partial [Acidobacteriaceae bacterium]
QDLVFQEGANFVPYVNSGDGKNFAQKTALTGAAPPLYPSAVLLNDVDGDGNGDLVVVYYNTASNPAGAGPVSPYQAYVWWGNGDGTFAAPTVLNLSRNYYLGAVADMNGDGRPDLILSDSSLVSILYNQGSRSFGTVLANGELSSEQHFLAGQGINSLSVADVNGDGEPDLIVANGGVTISNPIALGGETASSLSLTPNPDVNTGGVTVILSSISTSPITGTLAALPEPSTFGAMFTLAATLTPSPSVAAPTGTVQFSIDGIPVGNPVPVVPGSGTSTATYAVPAGNTYVGGQHTLGASYNGDARNSPLTFNGTHVVQDDTTSTVLALCVGPSPTCPSNGLVSPPYTPSLPMVYGQTYNGIASVTASDGGPVPGNTLILDAYNGGAPVVICTLLTQAGGACPSSVGIGTQVGVHVLTAQYVPGANDTHTGSTSAPVTITVTQDTIGASLAGLPNPASVGQPVALTVTLTGGNAPPGGPQASLGTYGPPTGQVVFNYGSAVLGIGTLATNSGNVSSSATITTSLLPLGADTITATYAGNLDFAPTTATAVETITPSLAGSFALAVTPTPITVGVGYAALFKVTVTSLNGFAQTVNLSCANLPTEATCHFDSTQIAAGNGVTQMIVFTSAPHSCGSTQPYFLGSNGAAPFALPTLACFAVLFVPGRRRWLRALVALAICVVAVQITGCGNCTDLGTRPGTYTFQVSGTSSSTSEVKSQPVTITVAI